MTRGGGGGGEAGGRRGVGGGGEGMMGNISMGCSSPLTTQLGSSLACHPLNKQAFVPFPLPLRSNRYSPVSVPISRLTPRGIKANSDRIMNTREDVSSHDEFVSVTFQPRDPPYESKRVYRINWHSERLQLTADLFLCVFTSMCQSSYHYFFGFQQINHSPHKAPQRISVRNLYLYFRICGIWRKHTETTCIIICDSATNFKGTLLWARPSTNYKYHIPREFVGLALIWKSLGKRTMESNRLEGKIGKPTYFSLDKIEMNRMS